MNNAVEGQRNIDSARGCPSDAATGLCTCQIVIRSGLALAPPKQEPKAARACHIMSGRGLSSRRWLTLIKVTDDTILLSMFYPWREKWDDEKHTSCKKIFGHGFEEARQAPMEVKRAWRLSVTWTDWADLGYGPLQWMSHSQREFLGLLALSWVTFADRNGGDASPDGVSTWEACLNNRPRLFASTRTLDGARPAGINAVELSHARVEGKDEIRHEVVVKDEGNVLRVEAYAVGIQDNHRHLEGTFGAEVWKETGLGELLWMDHKWRRYLARRISHQVRW